MVLGKKDRVKLTIRTEPDTLIPGDLLRGCLEINALRQVECTALLLEFVCLEHAAVTALTTDELNMDMNESYLKQDFLHYQKVVTVAGRTGNTGREGGCFLSPGVTSFPFELQLPPTIPPTHRMDMFRGSLTVSFFIRAFMDVLHGSDKETKVELTILPAMPASLYESTRFTSVPIGTSSSPLYRCRCDDCFCGERSDSSVTLAVSAAPPFLILPLPDDNQPACNYVYEPSNDFFSVPPPNTFTTRLMCTITNSSKTETVKGLKFTLSRVQSVAVAGYTKADEKVLVEPVVNFGDHPIVPGETREFGVMIQLPYQFDPFRDCPNTFATGATSLVLSVNTFGGLKLKYPVVCNNALYVAATLDGSNAVPAPPYSFTQSLIETEAEGERLGFAAYANRS